MSATTEWKRLAALRAASLHYRTLGTDELTFVLTNRWQELGLTIDPHDFTDAEAIAAVACITNGNFRLIQRLFTQITRIRDINQLNSITRSRRSSPPNPAHRRLTAPHNAAKYTPNTAENYTWCYRELPGRPGYEADCGSRSAGERPRVAVPVSREPGRALR